MKASEFAGRIYNIVVFADEHRENAYECGGLEKMIRTYYASDIEAFEMEIVKYFYENGSLLSHTCIEEIVEAAGQLVEDINREGLECIRSLNNNNDYAYCELVFKVAGFKHVSTCKHPKGIEHKYNNLDFNITAIENMRNNLEVAYIK